jgi:hypothetical protein
VVIPGGRRPRSHVRFVKTGHALDGSAYGLLRTVTKAGKTVTDYVPIIPRPGNKPVALPKVLPAFGSNNWIAHADWSNTTGSPINCFTTTWVVPPPPASQSSQVIFIFNGITNSTMIYQPVLQWGFNGLFGGNYWVVASWYAAGQGGTARYSSYTLVNPGDVLVGVITRTGQSPSGFNYTCQFQGIANSTLVIQDVEELKACSQTLEAYNVTNCSNYPNADNVAMSAISIETAGGSPNINWAPVNSVTDCGQQARVGSNANPGGEVDIYFRRPAYGS